MQKSFFLSKLITLDLFNELSTILQDTVVRNTPIKIHKTFIFFIIKIHFDSDLFHSPINPSSLNFKQSLMLKYEQSQS